MRPTRTRTWIPLAGGLLLGLAVSAVLSAGARADPAARPNDEVSFRVEASREIANDRAVATVGLSLEGADPAVLAGRLNEKMAAARAQAGSVKDVRVMSAPSSSHPVYEDGRIRGWRVQQDLVLESAEPGKLAAVVGELQEGGLLLRGMRHEVAEATRVEVEQALLVEALAAMQARADLVAKSLGRRSWTLVSASIDGAGPQPARYERAAMTASAAPVVEAGTTRLRVTVQATIRLAGKP
jgi:predicted secreted protein